MINRSFLAGAGLVIVGIMIGVILAPRFMQPIPVQPPPAKRAVEPVQIGNPDYTPPAGVMTAVSMSAAFKEVARSVTPTVVSINAISNVLPRDEFHEFEEEAQRRPFRSSAGSGVLISKEGHIVTNYHVINGATEIGITLSDKREFRADIIGVDPTTDLAVIQISEPDSFPVITLGDSDQLEVGDWVIAIGNPFRLTSTVTAGIVSAKNRQIQIFENEFGIEDFIQTDAAINPGNSGGALVNLQGQLIGINTAIATERGSYEGYGFAVPVNLMTHVVGDLIAYGEVYRGYLGVQIMSVDAVDAQRLGMDVIAGVRVDRVVQASAAERAGIRVDDVILSIDGFEVNSSNQLQSRIARHHPGDSVGIEIWRDGSVDFQRIALLGRDHVAREDWVQPPDFEEIPDPAPETPFQLPEWGIGLKDLTDAERDAFGVDEGAYIAYIQGGTPASIDGLPRDVVITSVEGEPVANVEEAFQLFDLAYAEEEETVLIRVKRRDGLSAFYEVQVPTLD